MAAKFLVLAAAVAACRAAPFYFSAVPGEVTVLRDGREDPSIPSIPSISSIPSVPSIAYGIGGGFASDIAGIKHSNSFGVSYETGNAKAFGGGIGQSNSDVFAGGVGLAETGPPAYRTNYPSYRYTPTYNPYYTNEVPYYTPQATPYYSYPYNVGYNNFGRNTIGNAVSSAQNIGNSGTAIAQAQNGPFGSVASTSNINPGQSRFGNSGFGGSSASAVSSGFGGATAISTSDSRSGIATSSAHTHDAKGGFNSAVSASQISGGVRANTAQTVQKNGNEVLTSGATSVEGPDGLQISNAHAHNSDINAGTYY